MFLSWMRILDLMCFHGHVEVFLLMYLIFLNYMNLFWFTLMLCLILELWRDLLIEIKRIC